MVKFAEVHSDSWHGSSSDPSHASRALLHQKKVKKGDERARHQDKDNVGETKDGALAWGVVDHPFSTDKSRAKKVDSWKTVRPLSPPAAYSLAWYLPRV